MCAFTGALYWKQVALSTRPTVFEPICLSISLSLPLWHCLNSINPSYTHHLYTAGIMYVNTNTHERSRAPSQFQQLLTTDRNMCAMCVPPTSSSSSSIDPACVPNPHRTRNVHPRYRSPMLLLPCVSWVCVLSVQRALARLMNRPTSTFCHAPISVARRLDVSAHMRHMRHLYENAAHKIRRRSNR